MIQRESWKKGLNLGAKGQSTASCSTASDCHRQLLLVVETCICTLPSSHLWVATARPVRHKSGGITVCALGLTYSSGMKSIGKRGWLSWCLFNGFQFDVDGMDGDIKWAMYCALWVTGRTICYVHILVFNKHLNFKIVENATVSTNAWQRWKRIEPKGTWIKHI